MPPSENTLPEDLQRNYAFQSLNAIREAVGLAKRTPQQVTYENTLDLIYDINPTAYNKIISLLTKKNESEIVRFYKAMAEAFSTAETTIDPVDLIQKEIDGVDTALAKSVSNKKVLSKRRLELLAAINYFKPRKISENKILNRDYYLATRTDFIGNKLYQDDHYTDYRVADDRVLRLRFLHPDFEENILGADLIYEQFDLINGRVRFVHLQYKMWNTNNLYFTEGSIIEQLDKMENNLCQSGYCHSHEKKWNADNYRFPYCSGFLRPTSRIQDGNSKLISTGIHIPICAVQKLRRTEKKLTRENTKSASLSHLIFEEMFVNNLLGSNWINIDELEKFYEERNILSFTDNIRIHAQEVIYETESAKQIRMGR